MYVFIVLVGLQAELHLGALLDQSYSGLAAGLWTHGQLLHHRAQQLLGTGVFIGLDLPGAVQHHDQVHIHLLRRRWFLDEGALLCTPAGVCRHNSSH